MVKLMISPEISVTKSPLLPGWIMLREKQLWSLMLISQDPPEVIPLMIEKWKDGYDVIYGRRVEREGETL